jgi:hypothetical protein
MTPLPLPEQFLGFGQSAERDGCATYGAICRGVAGDPRVMALVEDAPPAQRRPNLLMAAVHSLLLAGADHPLSGYYDTVGGTGGDPADPPRDDVAVVFADFCRTHHDALVPLIATRSTQTNEVGRCAGLLPALCRIGRGGRLSVLDLGTSAGLNLLFDQYGYLYRHQDGDTRRAGSPASGVTIECMLRSDPDGLPASPVPEVSSRVGLDLSPIDPTSDDEALWLQACLWPDNLPRFDRLKAALHVARTTAQPARFERGDLVDDLARVAATINPADPLVVFHTWVAAYLTEGRQRELVAAVRSLGQAREVHYLYAEAPNETPGLPTPLPPDPGPTANLVTALVHVGPAGSAPVRLADMHPHGKWVRWLG